MKTALINRVHRHRQKNEDLPVADLAATFQQQVVTILLERTFRAVDELGIKTVLLSGGVAANGELRKASPGRRQRGKSEFSARRWNSVLITPPWWLQPVISISRRVVLSFGFAGFSQIVLEITGVKGLQSATVVFFVDKNFKAQLNRGFVL